MRRGLGLGPGAEFDLIRRFLSRGAEGDSSDVSVGPGDDCAVVGRDVAVSIDLSIEGVHFRREWMSFFEIGWRAASAAFSDLAAMAARPVGAFVGLAVAEADADEAAVAVMEGIRDATEAVGGAVLGGDLTRSPGPMVIDVAVLGRTSSPILRSGARPGDDVWVTGELGAAAAAVQSLLRGEDLDPAARARLVRPHPRTREALWLADRGVVRAMLDLSDGLLGDAGHLAAASGAAIVLDRDAIPVDPAARSIAATAAEALSFAVSGGEDYELCFCTRPGALTPLAIEFETRFDLPVTRVGRVESGAGVFWREGEHDRSPAEAGGFQHFEARE